MNLHTSNKLKILIGTFFIGFVSLFIVNQLFTTLIQDLDKQTNLHETKIKIGEFVAEDIQTLKALFYQLSLTTTNERSRQVVINEIKLVTSNITDALDILENGGELNRKIALNVAGRDTIFTKLFYDIAKDKSQISLEVIDIKPKLIEFNEMIAEVNNMLAIRYKYYRTKENENFFKYSQKLSRYYKSTPAFFNRMSENIKRLLYEGDIELKRIQQEIYKKQTKYLQIKVILMAIVLLINTIVAIWLSRSISAEHIQLINLNKELESKENFVKAILNGQENMVIVSDGQKMIEANDFIADFFDEFDTINDFRKTYNCICDKFEANVPDDSYINKQEYGNQTWLEYVLTHENKHFKVIMNNGRENHHFSLIANKKTISDDGDYIIVVSLSDITNEINAQKELSKLNDNLENLIDIKTKELQELNSYLEDKIQLELQKNREKDKQMIQQSRFAALGEMIGNIAHQWRQPLSAISSTASSVEMQIELEIASRDDIKKSYKDIKRYVNFLNQTIEDFRGFFKEDKEFINFDIRDIVNKSFSIIQATYKDNNIVIDIKLSDKALISQGMPNELSQVFLNILNNARDAIKEKNPLNRNVIVYSEETSTDNIIYIQDNAGGIPQEIIGKIFDPYFTTKHQSQGTGIGLYMSKNIVENNMKGGISVSNVSQTINEMHFNGACFKITLPKSS
jgi:signal transduction histidine kinase